MTDPLQPPQNTTTTPSSFTVHTPTAIAGAVVVVALIGAAVALAFAHWQTASIIGLLTLLAPIAVGLVIQIDQVSRTRQTQADQGASIATVERRTNGELDARIEAAISRALTATQTPATLAPAPAVPQDAITTELPKAA